MYGHLTTVKLLMKLGVDVHEVDISGRNGLLKACYYDKTEVVEFLASEYPKLLEGTDEYAQWSER